MVLLASASSSMSNDSSFMQSQHKWLADVIILEAIPMLPSGKIVARKLRELLEAATVAYDAPAPHAQTDFSARSSAYSGVNLLADTEKGILVNSERETLVVEQAKSAGQKKAEQAPTRLRRLREWVSVYRIMFSVIFIVNFVGIVATLVHKWRIGQEWSATFALAWITAGLFARSEVFLRMLYRTLLFLFKRWPPFWFRNAISIFLLNIGGIHSGSSVVGTLWVITAMIEFYRRGSRWIHASILAFALVASIILVTVCSSAWPSFREKYHNRFENVHRLVGWCGVFILWILVGLADTWTPGPNGTGYFDGRRLWHKPDVYLVIVITVMVFGPWTTYRRVRLFSLCLYHESTP